MAFIYVYRLVVDSGFAPCVDNGLLTLACCKGGKIINKNPCATGYRFWIGSNRDKDYKKEDIYLLGTFHDKFLYIAKVTQVLTMDEYYSSKSKGRLDDIYSLKDNRLVRNKKLAAECVHTDENQIKKDLAGKYVILSDDFIYLGRDAAEIGIVADNNPKRQEPKYITGPLAEDIIKACYRFKDTKNHTPTNPIHRSCNQK